MVAAPDVDLLRLERIPADAARRLAGDRFGVTDLPEGLAGLIEAKAEGHPLFIEELVYSLRDQGYVEVVDGRVTTAVPGERLENLDLPDTIHGLTSSRLSRLSAIEQTTVKVASVLGVSFDAELLAAIHPLSLDERLIAKQLDDLVRRDLITPTDSGFTFRHAVVQESAYEQLSLAMRRQLHEDGGDEDRRRWPRSHAVSAARPPLGGGRPAWNRLSTTSRGPERPPSKPVRSTMPLLFSARPWPERINSMRVAVSLPATRCAYIHQSLGEADGRTGPPRPGGGAVPGGPGQAGPRRVRRVGSGGPPASSRKCSSRSAICSRATAQAGSTRSPSRDRPPSSSRVLGQVHYFQADVPRWLVTNLRSINLAERAGDPGVAGPAYAGLGNLVGTVRLHRLARRYFGLARADPIRPVFEGQPGPLAAKIERDVTTPFHVAADLSEAVYLLAGKEDHSAEVIELLDRTVDAAERIASDAYGAALAVRGFARTIYGPLDLARQRPDRTRRRRSQAATSRNTRHGRGRCSFLY